MDEYPKMLFRDGAEIEWEGLALDTYIVADTDEEAAARANGWISAGEEAPKAEAKRSAGK